MIVIPVGILAVALLATACVPPPPPPPPGGGGGGGGGTPAGPTVPPTTTIVPGPPHLYSENPFNGWGHDGIAYSVDIAGQNVYVGGDFARASKGNQSVPLANVMAVQRTNGELLPGFVANTNGIVYAVISDGNSVWIGGDFSTVNGVAKVGLAKVDAATGAVDVGFTANAGNYVSDLLLVGNRLYAVGEFGQINSTNRRGAALLNAATGAVDPTFNPGADLRVNSVAINPTGTRLYLAGVFHNVGGNSRNFLAEVDPVTGNVQGPVFSNLNDFVRDVTVGPDGTVYVAAGGGMNSAIAFDPNNGRQRWRQRADGDVQAVKYSNGYLFFGFHDGFGGDNTLRILAANPATGALEPRLRAGVGVAPRGADDRRRWRLPRGRRPVRPHGRRADQGFVDPSMTVR